MMLWWLRDAQLRDQMQEGGSDQCALFMLVHVVAERRGQPACVGP